MPPSVAPVLLASLFAELVHGPQGHGGAFILNTGDLGLLRSLDLLTAADASVRIAGGATVAAHAQHMRYGLSLMNRWATEGGNPFADARWDEAWTISTVTPVEWDEIRSGLRSEAEHWTQELGTGRTVRTIELSGMVSSIAHVAYHMGAIRQLAAGARGPRDGTFLPTA